MACRNREVHENCDATGLWNRTKYVYDAQGQLAAEYATQPGPIKCTTCYLTADHLGSTRMVTDSNAAVQSLTDYLPFGEEIQSTVGTRSASYYPPNDLAVADGVTQKFTGKERDQETGLDYFGARYLSSAQGRFTSADPTVMTGQRISDPQQLNLYSYTRNNPLQFVDPDGKELRLAAGADASKVIPALAHAYTKAAFRTMFDQLSSSKNVFYIGNGDIKQDPQKEAVGIVTEGENRPAGVDPTKPISDTNPMASDTITLDNTFVFADGVTDYGKDFVIGHEFDHGVKIDLDPAGQVAQHNTPEGRKTQEDAANKKGDQVGTQKSSMSTEKATETVKKALSCSTDSKGTTTCK